MGLFEFKDKVGPGVKKDQPQAPAYILFFKRFGINFSNMIFLNLIYLFACVPIFTIGPATAGFTYVLRNYSQGKHVDMLYDFTKKCKEYFKPAFIISLIDILILAPLIYAVDMWSKGELFNGSQTLATIALFLLFYVLYMLICTNFYIFPMLVSFDLPLKKIVRNSIILANYKLGKNILMLLVCGVITLLCYIFWPIPVPFIICILFSFCGYFINAVVYPVLVKHVATPEPEKEPEDEEEIIFRDPK